MPFLRQKRVLEQLKKYEQEKPFTERELKRVTKRNTGEFRKEAVGKVVTTGEYRKAVLHAAEQHKIPQTEVPRLLTRWKKWLRQPYDREGSTKTEHSFKREEDVQPQDALNRLRDARGQGELSRARQSYHEGERMIEQHQQGASDPAQKSTISAQQFPPVLTAHGAGKSEGAQLLPTSPATLPPSDEEQTPEGQMHLRKHSAILEKARQHEHAAETMVVPQERQIETSIKPSSPHTKNPNTSTAALAPLSRQAHSVAVPLSSGQLEERKRFGARLAWWGLIFLLVVLWWREITTFSLWWGTLGTIAGFTVGLFLLPAFPLLQGVKDDWAGGALSLFLLLIALGLFFYSLRETSRFLRALRAARQKIKRPLP